MGPLLRDGGVAAPWGRNLLHYNFATLLRYGRANLVYNLPDPISIY